MTQVFISPEVRNILDVHGFLQDAAFQAAPIADQIARQAGSLLAAHAAGDARIAMQLMWWPRAQGRAVEDVMRGALTLEDARHAVAAEHGFDGWEAVAALDGAGHDLAFQAALDHIVRGELDALRAALAQTPALATAQSRLGHRATLLHYLGANGVESYRQITPTNAGEMAQVLVDAGADRRAEANMYGGGQTAYALATTSAHPHRAGVIEALAEVLKP